MVYYGGGPRCCGVAPSATKRILTLAEVAIWQIAVVLVAAVVGFSIAGVAGFGGGLVALPVLVWAFGPEVAVPVVTIAQINGTVARVWLNRSEINRKVAAWFAVGSLPLAALGAFLFINADTALLTRLMGGAMIALVALAQLPWARRARMALWGFPPLGASAGFLAAVVGVPGPYTSVFFIAYGLKPREYLATFSLSMGLIQLPKLAVYGGGALLTPLVAGLGLAMGVIAIGGAWFGARALRRIPDKVFAIGINVIIVSFGVLFLITG